MVYDKHDWQDGELITSDNLNHIENGIATSQNVIKNVKDYGAVGDRLTDDTQAFKSAVFDISSTGGQLLIPTGKYIISDVINLEYIDLVGESRENTFIFGKNTDYIFRLGNGARISGVTFVGSLNSKKLTSIKIGSINASAGGGSIKNIDFKGVAKLNTDGTVNDIGFNGIEIGEQSSSDNLTGIFPYTFGDLQFFDVTNGIVISPQAYNFFNGNHFDHIIVQGYVHSGLWFKKSENSDAISQNYFNDLQIQAKSYTSDNSGAVIIQHGINNYFNFLHTWTDGNNPVPSLVINGDLQTDKTKINSNIFSNCILESGTVTGDIYKGLNTFENVLFNDWSSKNFPSEVTSTKGKLESCKKNILSGDLIEKTSTSFGTLLSTPSTNTNTVNFDDKGYYLNVSSTSTNHLIYLNIDKKTGDKLRKFGIVSAGFVFDTANPKSLIPQVKIILKNSSTGAVVECPTILKQIGKTTNGSYIVRSVIDVSNVDTSYDLTYFTLYNRAANDIKIRELQLVDGYYSVNNTIHSEKANYYRNSGTIDSPTSFLDIGITNMYQTNLISGRTFDSNLLTTIKVGDIYEYEYKIYV